jgi:hypothetical protein
MPGSRTSKTMQPGTWFDVFLLDDDLSAAARLDIL